MSNPGISVLFAKRFAQHLRLIGELCGGLRAGTEKAIGILHGTAKSVWVTPAEPDGRMRFLKRLRLHGSSVKLPEMTLERHAWLGPQRLHQLQTFIEPRHERFGINTERGEHPRASPSSQADLKSAAGELI